MRIRGTLAVLLMSAVTLVAQDAPKDGTNACKRDKDSKMSCCKKDKDGSQKECCKMDQCKKQQKDTQSNTKS